MLCSLLIQNYALISSLSVDFTHGLTTITGETGAGKSILMGALSLILGERADTTVLKNKQEKCIVEGKFEIEPDKFRKFFESHDLDLDQILLLRREIVPSGKSRAFINDSPVVLTVLKELGNRLVNIHAQHENLMLNQDNFPMLALDAFLELDPIREAYNKEYLSYRELESKLIAEQREYEEKRRNQDFMEFQLNQLTEARLEEHRQEELESEQQLLEHAEEIQLQLGAVVYTFDENEQSVLAVIKESVKNLQTVADHLPALSALIQRLDQVFIESKDIIRELNALQSHVESNPEQLTIVKEKLDLLYSLQHKHQVPDQESLIAFRDELESALAGIHLSADHIEKLEGQVDQQFRQVLSLAKDLSSRRKKGIPLFCQSVIQLLLDLGMPNAQFEVRQLVEEEPAELGIDDMSLLFAANKNQNQELVAKVASGGEISRLMLSIKSLMSGSQGIPTLIFDEIDAGVSGEIADKLGKMILKLSEKRQVINITHLPQVAKSGNHHYLVYKEDDENSTHTRIKRLNQDERILELAKMLSGELVTDEAMLNAQRLLN